MTSITTARIQPCSTASGMSWWKVEDKSYFQNVCNICNTNLVPMYSSLQDITQTALQQQQHSHTALHYQSHDTNFNLKYDFLYAYTTNAYTTNSVLICQSYVNK